MNKDHVLGFLTDIGGKTSHSAIMARMLETPAVVGLKTISKEVKSGDMIAFDGRKGEVYINPEAEIISEFKARK